jgi:hypothetical protein
LAGTLRGKRSRRPRTRRSRLSLLRPCTSHSSAEGTWSVGLSWSWCRTRFCSCTRNSRGSTWSTPQECSGRHTSGCSGRAHQTPPAHLRLESFLSRLCHLESHWCADPILIRRPILQSLFSRRSGPLISFWVPNHPCRLLHLLRYPW